MWSWSGVHPVWSALWSRPAGVHRLLGLPQGKSVTTGQEAETQSIFYIYQR